MNPLSLLNGPFGFGALSFLHQTLGNFLLTRSLTAAVVLALCSRFLARTRLSWLFPS